MVSDTRIFWRGFQRDLNKYGWAILLELPVSMNASTLMHLFLT